MPWAPDYVTLPEAKAYLRITDTVDDAELPGWITAASRGIDHITSRQFGQLAAPAARVYRRPPIYDCTIGLWCLDIDDLQDVTGFLVDGVAYASTGALLLPDNAPADGRPWTRLGLNYPPIAAYPGAPQARVLTGRWGWTAFPAPVVDATKLQLARWNMRRDSPWGIVGSPDQGNELRLLAKLDPDVTAMLRGYGRRRRVG